MTRLHAFAATALLLAAPASLRAQDGPPTPVMKGDMSGTVAWVNANKGELTDYDHWRSQAGFSLGGGRYWTDHHITRIEVGATTTGSVYSPVPLAVANNQTVYVPVHNRFSTRRVSVMQLYQFRRNEWAHPFVGAGVDAVWDRVETQADSVYVFDPVTRQQSLIRPRMEAGERTSLSGRGVLTGGVKAYMARKAFAVAELRVSIGRRRTEDVQWRFGLGVDF
jgi:opacity protein-like surface antigen